MINSVIIPKVKSIFRHRNTWTSIGIVIMGIIQLPFVCLSWNKLCFPCTRTVSCFLCIKHILICTSSCLTYRITRGIWQDECNLCKNIDKDNPMSMHTDRTNAVIYFWTKINLRPHITRVIFYARWNKIGPTTILFTLSIEIDKLFHIIWKDNPANLPPIHFACFSRRTDILVVGISKSSVRKTYAHNQGKSKCNNLTC